MFWHVFKYAVKSLFRTKEIVFWSFLFPFALATFMYLAFGNIFETTEKFHVIPVAVVEEEENPVLDQILDVLTEEGENQLLEVQRVEKQDAEKLLEEENVKGIIYEKADSYLTVKESGMEETILQMILQQIKQSETIITDILSTHPEKLQQVVAGMSSEAQYCVEKNYSSGNQDNVVNYFYAVVAMTCLFGCFSSCYRICMTQANTSSLGMRRSLAATSRMKIILVEFCSCELVQFLIACLLFVYLRFVLGLQIGDDYGSLALLLFASTSAGVMMGLLVGALPKGGINVKTGVLTSISLFLCMLSDLMVSGVKDWIEHRIPIINDLNPAALITDSFYALNIYDTNERFLLNITILLGMTAVMGIACFLMVRRAKYASL